MFNPLNLYDWKTCHDDVTLYDWKTCHDDVTFGLGDRFYMSRKDGARGGGWTHPKGAKQQCCVWAQL